jgi:hypothetical protein
VAAHGLRGIAMLWLASAVAASLTSRITVPINLVFPLPPRDLPLIELLAVVFGCTAVAMARPRMAEWEKLGAPRVSLLAALTPLTIAVMAVAVAVVGSMWLPGSVQTGYLPANVLLFVAVGSLVCSVVGAVAGCVGTVLVFVSCCALQNSVPVVARVLPMGRPESGEPSCVWPLLALGVAMSIAAWNRGTTVLAQARAEHD